MKKILIYLLFFFLTNLCSAISCKAQQSNASNHLQGFKAFLLAGPNFSQLSGDNFNGYRMVGLRAGTEINYALNSNRGVGIGLFYDEKGSSASFSLFSKELRQQTKLRYLSIPIYFYLDSAYRPEIGKNRIRFQLGISISRLFSVMSENEAIRDYTTMFSAFDIAPYVGLTYFVSKKSGFQLRFESSLTSILKENLTLELSNIRSYLFSLQYIYSL